MSCSAPPSRAAEKSYSFVMASVAVVGAAGHRLVDLHEELDVALGLLQLAQHEFETLLAFESGQQATQFPHDGEFVLRHEQFLAPRAGRLDVDGREDALVGKLAPQTQFPVAGSL